MTDYEDDAYWQPGGGHEQAEHEEKIRERMRSRQLDLEIDARLEAEKAGKELGDTFAEALRAVGLDQKTYNELYQKDPQHIQESLKQSIREHTTRISRPRDSRGRYTKMQPQGHIPQEARSDAERADRRGLPNLSEYKEPFRKTTGQTTAQTKSRVFRGESVSDDELLDALSEIIS